MIKKNKYDSEDSVDNSQLNLPTIIKKDSIITIFIDYLNKLLLRNTNEKYRAEVYKVINTNSENN